MIGTILDGRYAILSLIGEGSRTAVYKARHQLMNRMVAVKLLRTGPSTDSTSRERFQVEAKAVSSLDHPNIVKLHDTGLAPQGELYLVMDLVEGKSLAEVIGEQHRLSCQRVVDIFIQCCAALKHAHQKGVIHRGITPKNIVLVTANGRADFVKIVDFGIAKILSIGETEGQQLTQTGELLGNAIYISPEQCIGRELDARSDIYSLACAMYEALTGSPPFTGETQLAIVAKQISEAPRPARVVASDLQIPARLEEILAKALQKDPGVRYQSMDELSADLLQLADSASKKTAKGPAVAIAVRDARELLAKLLSGIPRPVWLLIVLAVGFVWWVRANSCSPPVRWMVWSVERAILPADDPSFAQTTRELAQTYESRKKFADAAWLYAVLTSRLEEKVAWGNRDLLDAKVHLADLYRAEGSSDRSLAIYQQVRPVLKAQAEKAIPQARSNLSECKRLYTQLLHVQESIGDVPAKDLDDSLAALASLRDIDHDLDGSIELLRRLVKLRESVLGRDSRRVAQTLMSLGSSCLAAGRSAEAYQSYEEALKIEELVGPDADYHLMLYQLGSLCFKDHKLSRAGQLFTKLLKVDRESEGDDQAEILSTLMQLVCIARATGNTDKAELFLHQAYSMSTDSPGIAPDDALECTLKLGQLYSDKGRCGQAEEVLNKALDLTRATGMTLLRGQVLETLTGLYRKEGKRDRAEKCEDELKVYRNLLRQMHRDAEAERIEKLIKALQNEKRNDQK